MATDDCQISEDPNAESSRLENEEPNFLPALRGTEGSNNLGRGSLPFRIFSHNPLDTTDTGSRSSGACGTWSQDKPITLGFCRETKTAFEDLPVLPGTIGQNGVNSEGESSRRPNDANPSITEHASQEIQNAVESSSTRDKKIRFTGPLYQARTLASETLYAASGGEPENSLCSNLTSRQQAESTTNSKPVESLGQPISEPSTTKRISKREDVRKEGNLDESNDYLSSKLQQTADGETEEATDNTNKEHDDTIAEGNERLDTIESLLEFPFLPPQTDSRCKSSSASLELFSAPAHQTDASRQRNFPLGGVQQFPSTSGQSEVPSTPGSSNEAARRQGPQSKKTSIAPSVAGSGETKKGSMGLGALASSLVKWKINRARAKKREQQTIAKDAKHQQFIDRVTDRIKTELPRSLLVSIQEEAYPIILRTAQAYRSQLGAKHKLTVQASERLADLMRDLANSY